MFHVEQDAALLSFIQQCSKNIGITLSNEQSRLFIEYLKHLKAWNRSFNLTTITSDREIVIKHFVDSFAALNAVEVSSGSRLLDVGTGAGFPGVPLKIVRSDLNVTLVEPVLKKTSFLRFIVGILHLKNVSVFDGTLDQLLDNRHAIGSYDYITTRALNPEMIMEAGSKLLRPEGMAIFYSSQHVNGLTLLNPWRLNNAYSFDLPMGIGKRCISICSPSS